MDYSNVGLNSSKYSATKMKNLTPLEKDKLKYKFKMALKSYSSTKSNRQNIISFSVELLLQICKAMNVEFIQIGISILKFLLEVIDGPCTENQNIIIEARFFECVKFIATIHTDKMERIKRGFDAEREKL